MIKRKESWLSPGWSLPVDYVSAIAILGFEPHQVTLLPPVRIRMDCLVKYRWRDARSRRS